jgi:hypothetical protein
MAQASRRQSISTFPTSQKPVIADHLPADSTIHEHKAGVSAETQALDAVVTHTSDNPVSVHSVPDTLDSAAGPQQQTFHHIDVALQNDQDAPPCFDENL